MKPVLFHAACATLLSAAAVAVSAQGIDNGVVRARAIIDGPGGIQGVVTFKQQRCPGCPTPGLAAPPTDPGFRNFPEPSVELHQTGVCNAAVSFTTAGGHFDPGPVSEPNPDANHPFHMGDLPNLIVNNRGRGFMRHTTSRITLSPGPLSVFDADGTAVIVHLNTDRGITGSPGASGGPRIACGVVLPTPPGEIDDVEEE